MTDRQRFVRFVARRFGVNATSLKQCLTHPEIRRSFITLVKEYRLRQEVALLEREMQRRCELRMQRDD
jgi:hypothetical protein